jgi:hypothetical protein
MLRPRGERGTQNNFNKLRIPGVTYVIWYLELLNPRPSLSKGLEVSGLKSLTA